MRRITAVTATTALIPRNRLRHSNCLRRYLNVSPLSRRTSRPITSSISVQMEETVVEVGRVNKMLFDIIKSKTKVTETQLNEVIQQKKDWFISAKEALELGILTEIL
jgi:hypothetical protein